MDQVKGNSATHRVDGSSDFHDDAIRGLMPLSAMPAALETGHPTIDREHRQLLASMSQLRRICIDPEHLINCQGCSNRQRSQCETALVSLLGDLFAIILEHFSSEEKVMRDLALRLIDRELCDAHLEDHANISGKVQEIVAALDPLQTAQRIRDLDQLLSRWVKHHIEMHDVLLMRRLGDEHAALLNRYNPQP